MMKTGFFGEALCAAGDVHLEVIGPNQCSVAEKCSKDGRLK